MNIDHKILPKAPMNRMNEYPNEIIEKEQMCYERKIHVGQLIGDMINMTKNYLS